MRNGRPWPRGGHGRRRSTRIQRVDYWRGWMVVMACFNCRYVSHRSRSISLVPLSLYHRSVRAFNTVSLRLNRRQHMSRLREVPNRPSSRPITGHQPRPMYPTLTRLLSETHSHPHPTVRALLSTRQDGQSGAAGGADHNRLLACPKFSWQKRQNNVGRQSIRSTGRLQN